MFQMKQLAENIRKYRSVKKLTQTGLASILKISPQSVSKWECAQTVPDIENLCLIAWTSCLETIGSMVRS